MDHMDHCDHLGTEVTKFAAVIGESPLDVPVKSCPGWRLEDLIAHLGTVHRWAEHLVRTRAPARVGAQAMGLGEVEASAAWIRSGGAALVSTLRAADPDAPMWAWGRDQHVRFWSRRQLHETLVHRLDAELALGTDPEASSGVAADAIDEFLANLGCAAAFSPKVHNLRGDGGRIGFRATDERRDWTVVLHDRGFDVLPGTDRPDATLAGPALTLLLVVYRRRPPTTNGITVSGDASLADFWLANSALE
jgi:uncharacterized protein (TIGR03083 family)